MAAKGITGVAETNRVVGDLPDTVGDALGEQMNGEARAVANAVLSRFPSTPPLSGWDDYQAPTAKTVRDHSRAPGKETPLYKVVIVGKSATMADMAARGLSPSGVNFVAGLNRFGRASRWAWPAADANRGRIENRMGEIVDTVSRSTNGTLD